MRKESKKDKKQMRIKIYICSAVIVLGGIIALILPLRPSFSKLEKRELDSFPKFTFSEFADGTYFSKINNWYTNTFPFRDQFIAANKKITACYGFQSKEEVIGTTKVADKIPDAKENPDKTETAATTEATTEMATTERVVEKDGTLHAEPESFGTVYISDNRAFSVYYFNQSAVDTYAQAVNDCASKFQGKANVYDVLIPTGIAACLDEKAQEKIGSSNEKDAMDYVGSNLNDQVNFVNTFDTIKSHNSEYIYFGTDHHWTALGAYYAYSDFCYVKGITPTPLDSYETKTFSDFVGSFYASSNQSKVLKENPDTITAYVPKGTNKVTLYDGKMNATPWNIINDVSDYDSGSKYSCFIGSDYPYEEIENPQITDGSACVVIKESFGNAFVPFLVDNYQYVYVIDYRYYAGSLSELVESKNISDILFVNNIESVSTDTIAGYIKDLVNR